MFAYEIALCAKCSEAEEKCMICAAPCPGTGASGAPAPQVLLPSMSATKQQRSVVLSQGLSKSPSTNAVGISYAGSSVSTSATGGSVESFSEPTPPALPLARHGSTTALECSGASQKQLSRCSTNGDLGQPPQPQLSQPPPVVISRATSKMASQPSLGTLTTLGQKTSQPVLPLASGMLVVNKESGEERMAPRYCSRHGTTEQRPKANPHRATCTGCHTAMETTYAEFTFCAPCTNLREKCMLCGGEALEAGSYVPPAKGTIFTARSTPYAVTERPVTSEA